ncbi:MAG: flippase-like domain-containing protein [Phycisphaera sp.]|nr:flippase-like domain-containing protein [Phycisphaera sp.]
MSDDGVDQRGGVSWRKGLTRLAIGLPIAGLFIWLLVRGQKWDEVWATLNGAALLPLLVALPVLAIDFSVRTARWWVMLRVYEPKLPLRACFGPFVGSFAINNVTPMRLGDLVRVFGFRRQLQTSPMRLLGTLVVERILDLFTLLGMFFVGLIWLPEGSLPAWFTTTAVWVTGVGLAGVIIVVALLSPLRRVLKSLDRSPSAEERTLVGKAVHLADEAMETLSMFRSPGLLGQLVALSVLGWVLEGGVFFCVAWSLAIHTDPVGPWFSAAAGTVATLVPSTPGNVGPFDFGTKLGIIAYGADSDAAVAFALLVHLVLWLPVTVVGGLFFLAPRGRSAWHAAHDTADAAADASADEQAGADQS